MYRLSTWIVVLSLFLIDTARSDIANVDLGGDFLFEYFFGKNFDPYESMREEVDFFRTEFHLNFQADLDDNIMTRISLEGDRALHSYNSGTIRELDKDIGDLEVYIDEAFVKAEDIAGSGFSASAGRQFLNYGDNPDASDYNRWWGQGFVIADSRSDDPLLLTQLGSYEIDPFDAIVITHQSENTQIDVLHAREVDDHLWGPSSVTDNDASLTALYASYFGIDNHQIDLYATFNDQNGPLGSMYFEGNKWIIGGRSAGDISEEIAYKAELAYQFEDNKSNPAFEADAFSAQGGLNYHPQVDYTPNIGLLYTYLQHDGPSGSMTGFVSPFEGKTYGMAFEGFAKQLAQANSYNPFTNMHVLNVYGGINPMNDVALSLDFYYFLLDERLDSPKGKKTKDHAGVEIDSQIDYHFNQNLKTFLGGGVFIPGNAAEEMFGDDDQSYFVRAGVKVSF